MNIYTRQHRWIAAALVGLLTTAPAQGASFDCAKAQTKVEHMICDDQNLSELDRKLGQDYQDVIAKANEEQRQRVIAEQKHWLKFTRNVCEKDSCLKHAYWSRQAELETFFVQQSVPYQNESDKSEAIKQILATAPLYPSYDTPFCRQIFDDLKQMNDVRFVDPILQAQSYEDSALDPWKRQSIAALPFNMEISCQRQLLDADPDGTAGICNVSLGIPPFKLFELPPLWPSVKKRYIVYYDRKYGPINLRRYKPTIGDFGAFRQINAANDEAAVAYASGGRPSYNSIIEYQHQYYFLFLVNFLDSYWLSAKSVASNRLETKQSCDWSPVEKSIEPQITKPRKAAKQLPPNQGTK